MSRTPPPLSTRVPRLLIEVLWEHYPDYWTEQCRICNEPTCPEYLWASARLRASGINPLNP
jgi:hypothetical protein